MTEAKPVDRTDELSRRLVAEMPALRAWLRPFAGAQAEDVLQDAFARAWRYRHTYDATQPVGGWLRQIARRVWIDQRRRADDPERLGDLVDEIPAPRTSDLGSREELQQQLARLKPVERNIVLRFHRDQASLIEIAEALSLPVGTVKSHLHRARQRLAHQPPPD